MLVGVSIHTNTVTMLYHVWVSFLALKQKAFIHSSTKQLNTVLYVQRVQQNSMNVLKITQGHHHQWNRIKYWKAF